MTGPFKNSISTFFSSKQKDKATQTWVCTKVPKKTLKFFKKKHNNITLNPTLSIEENVKKDP